MRVEIRLFASLRSHLPPGSPRGRCELDLPAGTTIAAALDRLGIPAARVHLVLRNGLHQRELDHPLAEGDVLSVFPAVAGG